MAVKPASDSVARERAGRTGWRAALGLILAGLLAGFVIGEVALRLFVPIQPVFFEWDPLLGVRHRAGMKGLWRQETRAPVPVETNALRLRNRPLTARKPAGTVRVLMLGDSYLEGMQVPLDDLVSERLRVRLERAIPGTPVEVLNAGVAGWGQSEQSLYLADRGWRLEPDRVVSFLFLGNDLLDNWSRTGSRIRPTFDLAGDSLVLRPPRMPAWKIVLRDRVLAHLAIPKMIRQVMLRRFKWSRKWAADQGLIFSHPEPARHGAEDSVMVEICARLYQRMAADCAAHGAPLQIFAFPRGMDLARAGDAAGDTSGSWSGTGRRLVSRLRRSGMDVVTADSAFAAALARGDSLYVDLDGHWTARGHDLAARLLSERVLARGLAGPRDAATGAGR